MALIIILLKAGLSLNLADLKRVGRPAVMMACVPASFEILGFLIFAPHILGVTRVEAAVMGAVLSAVSPAVVIPRMVQLMEERYGTDKSIPQMIMAGASCDDIFVIVLFSTFVTMAQGGAVHGTDLLNVPVSIILGVALGVGTGYALSLFLKSLCLRPLCEKQHKGYYSSGSILSADGSGNMAEGNRIHIRSSGCSKYSLRAENKEHSRCIIPSFGKIWKTVDRGRGYSFVLVGAAVDIRYTLEAGLPALAMIAAALVFRSLGTMFCLFGTALNLKERLFCIIAYLPKATVQAAIGSVPLALGLPAEHWCCP